MDFFDLLSQHVGRTADLGNGHAHAYDGLGHLQHAWSAHADGHGATITNAFGVATDIVRDSPTGWEHHDSIGRIVARGVAFAGRTQVQDGLGRMLYSIDPTNGSITDSLGRLQWRFR